MQRSLHGNDKKVASGDQGSKDGDAINRDLGCLEVSRQVENVAGLEFSERNRTSGPAIASIPFWSRKAENLSF